MTQAFDPLTPVFGLAGQCDAIERNYATMFSSNAGVTVPQFFVEGTSFYDIDDVRYKVAITDSAVSGAVEESFRAIWEENDHEQILIPGFTSTASAVFVPTGHSVSVYLQEGEKALISANFIWGTTTISTRPDFDFFRDEAVSLSGVTNGLWNNMRASVGAVGPMCHPQILYVATQSRIHKFDLMMRRRVGTGLAIIGRSSSPEFQEHMRVFNLH